MKKRNDLYWRLCIAAVLVLIVIGYTPIMIPEGVYKPMLFGIPYSLWLGILATGVLVVITYIGSRVHPGSDKTEDEE